MGADSSGRMFRMKRLCGGVLLAAFLVAAGPAAAQYPSKSGEDHRRRSRPARPPTSSRASWRDAAHASRIGQPLRRREQARRRRHHRHRGGEELAARRLHARRRPEAAPSASIPAIYSKLPYDPLRDFEPIAQHRAHAADDRRGRAARPTSRSKDFVAAAKAKPGEIAYGSLGNGSTSHLTMEAFQAAAGIKLNHIPFKGSAEAQTQIIGGSVAGDVRHRFPACSRR